MKRRRLATVLLATFGLALAALCTPILAKAAVQTPTINFTVAGNSHYGYASLSDTGTGNLYGYAKVGGPSLPSGYYGAEVTICHISGTSAAVVGYRSAYTSSYQSGLSVGTYYDAPKGNRYHVFGDLSVYNPSTGGYVTKRTATSPILTARSLPTYQLTSNGQTYGDMHQVMALGCYPDLLLAEATNGRIGYVLTDELRAFVPATPQEATELASENMVRTIPVYSIDGDIIGSLVVGH